MQVEHLAAFLPFHVETFDRDLVEMDFHKNRKLKAALKTAKIGLLAF
jgi:hypothetical protein